MANLPTEVLQKIATMTPAEMTNRQIRLFCDNDMRWRLIADNPYLPPDLQNSRLPPNQQQRWDQINSLLMPQGFVGVQDGNYAQTFINIDARADISSQPRDRSVITVS